MLEALPPLAEPPISSTVTTEWRARRIAEGPRRTADGTRGRGSQARGCSRRIAFEALGQPRDIDDTDFNLLTFQVGQFVHDTVQRALQRHFGAVIEVPVSFRPDHDVSGHADAAYQKDSPHDVTVEIKSMKQWSFRAAVEGNKRDDMPPGPKVEHLAQAGLYAIAPQLDSKFVHIVYGGKDTGEIAEWLIDIDEPLPHVQDNPSVRQLAEAELARFDAIFAGLDAGMLPERLIPGYGVVLNPPAKSDRGQPWNCRFCPWQPSCVTMPSEAVAVERPAGADDDAPRRALLERVKAAPYASFLRNNWPDDLPKLSKSGWTPEQIASLTTLVDMLDALPVAPEAGGSSDTSAGVAPADAAPADDPPGRPDRGHVPDEQRPFTYDLARIRLALKSLTPEQLAYITERAKPYGIPPVDRTRQWTLNHVNIIDNLLSGVRELPSDWREVAKANGLTYAAVVREAKHIAEQHGLKPPSRIDRIGADVGVYLAEWINEQPKAAA